MRLQRLFVQHSTWKITEIVTSPVRCWQTVAAALIQTMYCKSAETRWFQRTYGLTAHQTWLKQRLHKAARIHPFQRTSPCSRNILGRNFVPLVSHSAVAPSTNNNNKTTAQDRPRYTLLGKSLEALSTDNCQLQSCGRSSQYKLWWSGKLWGFHFRLNWWKDISRN